ncbi:ABC transporter permease [Sinorhizobium meliloti]|uniref:ABC transporter permease n=1 Tax=Rhizobium meliloti TaxID=382 RepID=UPI00398D2A87
MFRLIFFRLVAAVPVLVLVAVMVFLMLRLAPGDPAIILAGDHATAEMVAAIRTHLGLDRSLMEQFMTWMGLILTGDFGTSVFSQQPVLTLIGQRVEPTLSLALTTLIFSIVVAVPAGAVAAARHGGWIDRSIMTVSVAGFSIPAFVLGYILIYVFAMRLGVLPVQGYVSFRTDVVDFFRRLALPTLTLSLIYIALFARTTRSSVLEVLGEDFIRTAHAKGISDSRVLLHHALRNAAIPIVSVVGIGFALMVGGVVVTETVFNIPGIGRLVVDAVLSRDYPVIQAVILLLAVVYVAINLLTDIAYILIDPRISY